jgi:hypothetical protein
MRTAKDFVDDMLRIGNCWQAILAVGNQIRGGKWGAEIREILREKKLMPIDDEEVKKLRQEYVDRVVAKKVEQEEEAKRTRPRRTNSPQKT